MLDGTIDIDGKARICPGSTARLTVAVDPSGGITVWNRTDRPVCLNGEGIARHGQDVVHIAAGGRRRFVPLVAVAD